MFVTPKTVFRFTLLANRGVLPPNLEGGEQRGHTYEHSQRALKTTESSPLKQETDPNCPQYQNYHQAGGKGRAIGNPITGV